MYRDLVDDCWIFANLLMRAARQHLYFTALVADHNQQPIAVRHGWAGGRPSRNSRAPYYGPWKAIEMVQTIKDYDPDVVMSPVKGHKGSGFLGGVRSRHDGLWYVTTCSGWSEQADAFMALALNFGIVNPMWLHHVGFRHESEDQMLDAVLRTEDDFAVVARSVPAQDHERYYARMRDRRSPDKFYWLEHQYFPKGPKTKGIHWDFVVPNGGLLEFISNHLEIPVDTWEAGPHDPIGEVAIDNDDGIEMAIMERPRWTDVDTW